MTKPRALAENLAVCAFVTPQELAELAPEFRTIINNRPDGEEAGQPTSAELQKEAHRLGLDYVHIPVVPGVIDDEQVAAFREALECRKGPMLAFCKSGRRAATLWALCEADRRGVEEILAAAAAAGHDLGELKPRLAKKASEA